jgi:uncharacterized damage-inducible protein DinB
MTEVARIGHLLEQSFEGAPYHGPSVVAVLRPVTRDLATRRVAPGVHTIWELTTHVGSEFAYARSLIDGTAPPWTEGQTTWPAIVHTSEAAWQATVENLEEAHRVFQRFLTSVDDGALDRPAVRGRHSVRAVLYGLIQHNAYHAGQISLLTRQFS